MQEETHHQVHGKGQRVELRCTGSPWHLSPLPRVADKPQREACKENAEVRTRSQMMKQTPGPGRGNQLSRTPVLTLERRQLGQASPAPLGEEHRPGLSGFRSFTEGWLALVPFRGPLEAWSSLPEASGLPTSKPWRLQAPGRKAAMCEMRTTSRSEVEEVGSTERWRTGEEEEEKVQCAEGRQWTKKWERRALGRGKGRERVCFHLGLWSKFLVNVLEDIG